MLTSFTDKITVKYLIKNHQRLNNIKTRPLSKCIQAILDITICINYYSLYTLCLYIYACHHYYLSETQVAVLLFNNCCDRRKCCHLDCRSICYRCHIYHSNRLLSSEKLRGGCHWNGLNHRMCCQYSDRLFACFDFPTHLTPRTPHTTATHHDVLTDTALLQHIQINYCFEALFDFLFHW